jgi:hypothetical protein
MRDKDCYCHTCKKEYHHLGIARHRAMHRDRNENCKITFSDGRTFSWAYARLTPAGADVVESGQQEVTQSDGGK